MGVFISYSHLDESIAKEIESKCEQGGVSPFLAVKHMGVGTPFADRIDEELRKCHTLLILITRNSKRSSWVAFEAGWAAALSKNLVPLGDVKDMPDVLKRWHARRLIELDDVIREIKEGLSPQISGEYEYKYEGQRQKKRFTYQGVCRIEQNGNHLEFRGRRKTEECIGQEIKPVDKEWRTEGAYLWDDLTINAEYRFEGTFNGYFRLHVDQYDSKGGSRKLNGYAYLVNKQFEYGAIKFEKISDL